MNERILALLIKDENPQPLYQVLKASGQLPAKQFGQLYWEQQINDIAPLAEKIKQQNVQPTDYVIDLQINGIKL